MKIFIPSPAHETVPDDVLRSIRVQGVEPEIIDCTFDLAIPKRKRIIMAKTKCKEIGLSCADDYVVLNDNDLVHLQADNFEVMTKFLEENFHFGAVSLLRMGMPIGETVYNAKIKNHICSGCIMFTREGLEKVSFDDGIGERPTCFIIGESLALSDKKYGYLDVVKRIAVHIRSGK
jgi:hypothetical protein